MSAWPCLLLHLVTDGNAAKRQAAEEAAKARKNKERLHAMFAKAAGRACRLCAYERALCSSKPRTALEYIMCSKQNL
jgi:hypothetical protein